MAGYRQENGKSFRVRLWDIAQAVVASLLFVSIAGGSAYLYGLGADHRALSTKVDSELEPINGKPRRDTILELINELEHWKSRGHRLEERVLVMDKTFHQEIEAVARFAAEIKSQCDRVSDRCEYYRKEMMRK